MVEKMSKDPSEIILDFYMKTNNKKYQKVDTKNNRDRSISEYIIESCINALGMYSEIDKFDIDKVIRMIFAINFTNQDLEYLNNKGLYQNLKEEFYKGKTKEALYARKAIYYAKTQSKTNNEQIDKLNNIYEKLRQVERTGHKYWNAMTPRRESVLEHIYGTIILMLGIESEFNYCLDYNKAIKMLLVHDTAETIIGDQTAWDITEEEKRIIEEKANKEIFGKLNIGEELIDLTKEFDKKRTYESEYSYLCDKLDYDLQVKAYELQGLYDFENRPKNVVTESSSVQRIIKEGASSVFEVHYAYDEQKYINNPGIRRILILSKDIKNSCK